jgi:hypothetical protein
MRSRAPATAGAPAIRGDGSNVRGTSNSRGWQQQGHKAIAGAPATARAKAIAVTPATAEVTQRQHHVISDTFLSHIFFTKSAVIFHLAFTNV